MNYNEFEQRLRDLVTKARNENVSIAGTTDIRASNPTEQDYSIEITRVISTDSASDD